MPKYTCKCGESLRFGEIPCSIEWKIVSDQKFDQFSGMVDAEEIYSAMDSLLKCPNCGRVWIFWDGFKSAPQEYMPINK